MGFSCEWLEAAFARWRRAAARRALQRVLCALAVATAVRALLHLPQARAVHEAALLVLTLSVNLFVKCQATRLTIAQAGTIVILFCDMILSMPTFDAIMPTAISIFITYSLLQLPFYVALATGMVLSVLQTAILVLFSTNLPTRQLLAGIVIHIWAHFVGIYISTQEERIARSAFLSARNAVEAESGASFQNQRLSKLLSAFLPTHLVDVARKQLAQSDPHIYAEHYTEVTVAYARLIGFDSVLALCSSGDAARVLKELDQRIDRLANAHGCVRIVSEGILVVSSLPHSNPDHANHVVAFASDLERLISSFADATTADVGVTVGVDSGILDAGVIGSNKWHYDVVGCPVDNAVLLQSNAPGRGVYVTEETLRQLSTETFTTISVNDCWKVTSTIVTTELFPVNKRFSLVTVPQAINRLLQTLSVDPTLNSAVAKKRKQTQDEENNNEIEPRTSFMKSIDLRFKNEHMETEYQKEMDHWFIPGISISLLFVVLYAIYHLLVMPWIVASWVFSGFTFLVFTTILMTLYINYFESFTLFITRNSIGHAIIILIFMVLLLLCGIVNTFSCPPYADTVICPSIHFSAFSFLLWAFAAAVFLRFPAIFMGFAQLAVVLIYVLQVMLVHPPEGPNQFSTEVDLLTRLFLVVVLIFLFFRSFEQLLRLDFLSVVKGVEESAQKDRLTNLNGQVLLNLVPTHVAPLVATRGDELWHHAHQSVGVAYMAVSGFDLQGEVGLNDLNYIFSYFDHALTNYRGIEKIRNSSRFYIVAVGMLPDAAANVTETPWTIGELLNTLTQYLLHISQFATEKQIQVQIGLDCGSALTLVTDAESPRYELWGETVERARLLMQAASHQRMLASEEIYLALRPRNLRFSQQPIKVNSTMNAYILYCKEEDVVAQKMEQEKMHTQQMFEQRDEMVSSMASSYSSELQSIEDVGETDSDIEWITPETALMHESTSSRRSNGSCLPYRTNYRESDYDPYRMPYRRSTNYKADKAVDYSDWSEQESRGASRTSNYKPRSRKWRAGSKSSLRNALQWFKKSSVDIEDPQERLEAAATRVDRMLQELDAYGDFANVKPLEYKPFPTAFGSGRSINRAMSSACHTEYDNAESEAQLSEVDDKRPERRRSRTKSSKDRYRFRWRRDGTDADAESQCSSIDQDPVRWNSVHSVGYENEYELDAEGLAIEEMKQLSRDIRRNFGDFELATFEDIDKD